MKTKPFAIGLAFVATLFSACEKGGVMPDTFLGKDYNGDAVFNGSSFTNSTSYQPVTKGSQWVYSLEAGEKTYKVTATITGATSTFNGNTYQEVSYQTNIPNTNTTSGYFYAGDHEFSLRGTRFVANALVDVPFLKDNVAAGTTWEAPVNDAGNINGLVAKFVVTLKERNVSKTVGGKTYKDVMNVQVDLQYEILGNYQSFGIYDLYVAKGIGIIKQDYSTLGARVTHETLVSYAIN